MTKRLRVASETSPETQPSIRRFFGEPAFRELSFDVSFHLASFLPTHALCSAALVCRSWRDVFTSDTLWRAVFAAKHGVVIDLETLEAHPYSVKELYGVQRKLFELCSNKFDPGEMKSGTRIPFEDQLPRNG